MTLFRTKKMRNCYLMRHEFIFHCLQWCYSCIGQCGKETVLLNVLRKTLRPNDTVVYTLGIKYTH